MLLKYFPTEEMLQVLESVSEDNVKLMRCTCRRWSKVKSFSEALLKQAENQEAQAEIEYYMKNNISPFSGMGGRDDDSD